MQSKWLLDSSALFAFLEGEDGGPRVRECLRTVPCLISWLSLLEVFYITMRERNQQEAERRFALLKQLSVTILWTIDESILRQAGQIKATYPMSVADSLIAAQCLAEDAVLLHKDPEYDTLQGIVRMEALPYKPTQKSPQIS